MSEAKQTVLVIDDDDIHLYTTRELLKNPQVDVVTHQGAFGATAKIKELRPDLVLLDVNMPALSGSNLAEILRPVCQETGTAIVFYSSNDEDSLKALVAAHGVHGYICKGDITALKCKVSDFLAHARLVRLLGTAMPTAV